MEIKLTDIAIHRPIILIVDDTPSNIQLLARGLNNEYEILVANSGKTGLEIMKKKPRPDLVLLDVMMPGLDGYDVCRQMKQDPDIHDIPVIFITADDDMKNQQKGFDVGAVDYITRPIALPLVRARISVHVQLKLKSDYLERIALIDGLTNIPNRRALEDTLARECGRSYRDRTPVSVMLADVDHFKNFNDYYGHGVGDICLRKVAATLSETLQRPGDFVGRYGGEEFLVILPECSRNGALLVAERLRKSVMELGIPHERSSASNCVTISIGVAFRPFAEIDNGEVLLDEADQALYSAKENGRNRVATM